MTSDGEDSGFGRYTLLGEIGAGGMATVHLARLAGPFGFTKTVAVKMLRGSLASDKAGAEMLMDEARLGARIHHPNVVATLDVIVRADKAMLVLDYVHGEALSKLMAHAAERGEPIPVPIAVAILADALAGLDAAHGTRDEAGAPLEIIHRDLSPQNVLVGVDGLARVADFGVAKAHGRVHETESGFVKGKAAYMAPEQARGEATQASDVYSLAVVGWELLVGRRLFAGATHAESLAKALSTKAPPIRPERGDVSEALEAVIMKGIRRDPSKRWPSARAMADALSVASPVASHAEVGEWVKELAAGSLAEREALLSSKVATRAEDIEAGALLSVTLPTTTRARSHRRNLKITIAGVAFGAATVVAFVAAGGFQKQAVPEARHDDVDAATAPSAALAAAPPVTTVASAEPATSAAPAASSAAPTASTASASPRRVAPPRTSPRRPKDCDPPYYVDANGRTQYKKDCLR